MKKLWTLLLAALMTCALAGCAQGGPVAEPPPASSPVASEQDPSSAPESSAEPDRKNLSDSSTPEISAPTPPAELSREQFDEIWTLLFGYWNAAEGRFAVIDAMDSNTAVFSDGIWDTGYGRDSTVSGAVSENELELTLTVLYRATEASEVAEAQPEKTETVIVDYSGLEQDGKIRIKIGEDDWRQYMFAGKMLEDAYQTYLDNEHPQ